jgi:hypothetical protein
MSLGNSYDNNKRNNTVYDPTVYSPYKMNNAEGTVDQTCISFSFWNNSLKISISPKKANTGSEGQILFDYDNGISIYLSHSKARILAEEIKKFISDPETYDNSGVPSGQGLITVSTGKEYGSPSPLIIIRKISETGEVMSSFAYQTKHDYYFAVRGYSEKNGFSKDSESYSNLELLQLVTLLEEFYKASTCATAYTVVDQLKYEHNRQRTVLNSIANKLGVEYGGGNGNGNNRRYNSTSYFNNNSGGNSSGYSAQSNSYTQATLDDID